MENINIEDYDYIDFGCSNGNSLIYGQNLFQGKHGIGVDNDPEKIMQAKKTLQNEKFQSQHTAMCMDVLNLEDENLEKQFKFTTCIHFLEHLAGYTQVQKAIQTAIKLSTDFVFILQPNKDHDVTLFKNGFKTYYSHWSGHTSLTSSYEFYKILEECRQEKHIKDYVIFYNELIKNSQDPIIHPLTSPIDQHDYDENIHDQKRKTKFKGVYKEIGVLIALKDDVPIDEYIQKATFNKKIVYDSRN